MQKYLLILSALFLMTLPSNACDICGCSVGGNSFGILPQFQKNFAGIRYQYRTFTSEHLTLFPGEDPLKTKETFHTTELWGRYVPHKRLHLFAFVPFNYYTKDEEQTHAVVSGLGDVSFMANYIIVNTGHRVENDWKHALQVGGGIKLPTGKSDHIQQHSGLLIPSLQTGTGAFDIPLNLIYTVRYYQLGINAEANYRINTSNKREYKFGDRLTSSARIFYWHENKNFSLLPHIGGTFEYGFRDKNKGLEQEYTGSQSVLLSVGTDIYYKRFIMGISSQIPTYQHIAQGQITGTPRLTANIAFLLQKQPKQTN